MDKVKSVFDTDEYGDSVDVAIKTAYEMALQDDAEERGAKRLLHASLSRPRVLDDEDLCVRDGYRDIVSMVREMQMAGRTLSAARADQYDPRGSDDVDPTTRPDYSYMDAIDDAKRVSERLKAQSDSSQAPETPAQASEAPAQAPETPSSQSAQ